MSFPLVLGALALAAGTEIAIVYLTFNEIASWLIQGVNLHVSEKEKIFFPIQEKQKSGEYKTIQGIFSPQANRIIDSRLIVSKTVDSEITELHQDSELVVYH